MGRKGAFCNYTRQYMMQSTMCVERNQEANHHKDMQTWQSYSASILFKVTLEGSAFKVGNHC